MAAGTLIGLVVGVVVGWSSASIVAGLAVGKMIKRDQAPRVDHLVTWRGL